MREKILLFLLKCISSIFARQKCRNGAISVVGLAIVKTKSHQNRLRNSQERPKHEETIYFHQFNACLCWRGSHKFQNGSLSKNANFDVRWLCDSNFPPKRPWLSRSLASQIRLSLRITMTHNTTPYVQRVTRTLPMCKHSEFRALFFDALWKSVHFSAHFLDNYKGLRVRRRLRW